MMVKHVRVQYREKDRKKETKLKGGRAASPVLGKENQAQVPRVNSTRYGLRTFRYETSRIWNRLPNEIRAVESYPQFGGCYVP